MSAKEPCIIAKEPYISAKEPDMHHDVGSHKWN